MINASVCTIGDEILIGQIVDTNSSAIAREFNAIGLKVTTMKSIGDDHDTIVSSLDEELRTHEVVVATGGLGPTKDDINEEMQAAVKAAQAADFVQSKGGLDMKITAEGRNLSGGQRQRLSIARALVGNPEILILDDSASALDYVTEKALRGALSALPNKPTVFIVSQRTSSLRHADKILVLDNGALVGCGTHDALLANCSVYREIYDSQFGGKEAAAK